MKIRCRSMITIEINSSTNIEIMNCITYFDGLNSQTDYSLSET